MAAPSGTTWGSTVGSYGRIGIYIDVVTNNATTYAFKVQIWFKSKYSVSDSSNTLYFNNRASSGSATNSLGSKSVSTTVDSGGGWSTSNEKRLYTSGTYTYTRGTSSTTRYIYAKLAGIDRVGGTMYASRTITIAKLASYTVSYDANGSGASGAPASQTKWYDISLTLSDSKPTRTGYTFQGWNTNSTGTGSSYNSGASYTSNASATLFAQWKVNTWTVKYDANGGTGAPSDQTKTYGQTLTLSKTVPTRTNYKFLGWATSKTSSTVSYKSGESYTSNADATLFAVWELAYIPPKITNLSIVRCTVDENGRAVLNDEGTNALVKFKWTCDPLYEVTDISIKWKTTSEETYSNTKTIEGISGTGDIVEAIVGNNLLSAENTYDFLIKITDTNSYKDVPFTLPSTLFVIDMLGGGKGVSFGKVADEEDTADFNFGIHARKNIVLDNNVLIQARNTDDTLSTILHQSPNNNTVLGYDNYVHATGNTNVYGRDINHYVSNIATPSSYRPYRRRGDTLTISDIRVTGYVTNSGKDVRFFIPLSVPIMGSPTISVASGKGFVLIQNGNYTHGSSGSTYVTPDSYSTGRYMFHGISINASFSNTTNAVNNSPIGIVWDGTITFS